MSSTEERGFNLTFAKLMALSSVFFIPGIGLIITVVIFGTDIKHDISTVKEDVKNLKSDVSGLRTKIDTVERRQAIYTATHR